MPGTRTVRNKTVQSFIKSFADKPVASELELTPCTCILHVDDLVLKQEFTLVRGFSLKLEFTPGRGFSFETNLTGVNSVSRNISPTRSII